MKLGPILALAILTSAPVALGEPTATWESVDFRGVQVVPNANGNGVCTRVWFETRQFELVASDDGGVRGSYLVAIEAFPVGTVTEFHKCEYPPPAVSPVTAQNRTWSVIGVPVPSNGWRLQASPGLSTGPDLEGHAPFEATMIVTDGALELGDAGQKLLFARPALQSNEARAALEAHVHRLHTACESVLTSLEWSPPSRENATTVCRLRQEMAGLLGDYLGLKMRSTKHFDRSPRANREDVSELVRQPGIYFSFSLLYEKEEIPGDAVLIQDDDKWALAALWH